MKKAIILLVLLGLLVFGGLYAKRKFYDPKHRLDIAKTEVKQLADNDEIQNGDLIFQTSLSNQSKAIQLATKSKYSHCDSSTKKARPFMFLRLCSPLNGRHLTNGLLAEKAENM